ncbi:MAG: hypothetical protein ACLQIB_32270, partial [Isosphaeraceae bacterium]
MSSSPPPSRPKHPDSQRRRTGARNRRKFILSFQDLEMRRLLSVFQVTSTGDNGGVNPAAFAGTGTFRQAIIDSNATPGSNTIDFSIGTGAQTISLLSALPSITVPVKIDGTTQPGHTAAPLIDLDGTSAGAGVNGLDLAAGSDGSSIIALAINNFAGDGISIMTTDNTVEMSYIGTNAAGTAAGSQPMAYGVVVTAANNTIGPGNLISANTSYGVQLTGAAATGNTVEGNLIGTNAAGTAALANGTGVQIDTGASGDTIGGTAAAASNIISGNSYGVTLNDTTSDAVEGNYIGTDVTGSIAVANGIGVLIWASATGNTIGGPAATTGTAPGNVISGNSGVGIFFNNNVASNGDLVEGNLIGTDAAGTAALGNGTVGGDGLGGFYILSNGSATHETIGGTAAADRNVISGNNGAGFEILNDNSNLIEGNYVGLDITGTSAIPNVNQGIQIVGSNDNTVGGAAAGAGNVISGNLYNATAGEQLVINDENLSTQTASGNLVQGNLIGTNAAGTGLPSGMSFDYDGTGVNIIGCATGNTIGGTTAGAANVIAGNATGVFIGSLGFLAGHTTSGNVVEGNDIGVEANGTTALANTVGVLIQSSGGATSETEDNTIGGATALAANIISGNTTYGIEISGPTATGNVVEGDYVGTDVSGTVAVPNGTGVETDTGASANTIGGLTATPGTGAGNVISGNAGPGVSLLGPSNVVLGNLIGTSAGGEQAIPNGLIAAPLGGINGGVYLTGFGNTIGGTVAGAGNVISGNINQDVLIGGSGATDDLVAGNYIGLDLAGTTILTTSGSNGGIVVLTPGNTIGGTTAAARNVIANDASAGVYFQSSSATGNLIEGNYFGTNASGTVALAYWTSGVWEQSGSGNTIGGTVAGAGNLFAGPTGYVSHAALLTSGNLFAGNLVDTNPTGTAVIGQMYNAVAVAGSNNTIGGTVAAARNILSTDAIWLESPAQNNLVEGNFLGLDITGTVKLTSNGGIEVDGPNNTIGGTVAGAANVGVGVLLTGGTSTGNLVEGNLIGTDVTGTVETGAGGAVTISGGATNNTIGGATPGSGNVIDGGDYGVSILTNSPGNLIEGNKIGTDITGTESLGVYHSGILVVSASNTIGGTAAGAGNLIAGFGNPGGGNEDVSTGIWLDGSGATGNLIEGNLIGTDVTGEAILNSSTHPGIYVAYGAVGNTVGGTAAGAGNTIDGFGQGIFITQSATGNVVEGNLIGTDETGATALGNTAQGILITLATSNTIGGTAAGAGNVVSGNLDGGVEDLAGGNLYEGNLIGTNAAGTAALPNTGDGIDANGSGSTIGGSTAGAGNLISGNTGAGVGISGGDNLVEGNEIGTDLTGTVAIANGAGGIGIVAGASGNTIGGSTATPGTGAGNLISGNNAASAAGIEITGTGASNNVIEGNVLGLNSAGAALANYYGVEINSSASGNTIGGLTSTPGTGAGNVISGNAASGVFLTTTAGNNTLIEGNLIGLAADGTTRRGNTAGVFINWGFNTQIGGTAVGAGNVISANATGILLSTSGSDLNTVIEGNYVGTDVTGTLAKGNSTGIDVGGSPGTVIGGTVAGAGNVISGNTTGVFISGISHPVIGGTYNSVVEGNLIGLNAAGTSAVGNATGVLVGNASNAIGGSSAGAGNVISGNTTFGVQITGASATGNVGEGNLIGTDYTGTQAIANYDGVEIDSGATGNLIGTNGDGVSDALERNVLSGNLFAGVVITGTGTDQNVVAGNYIGTNATATSALGNGSEPIFDSYGAGIAGGVEIENGASNNLIGTSGQSADDAGEGNIISGSLGDGVDIYGSGTTGNVVAGNFIGTNATGTAGLSNAYDGVYLAESASNWVGVNPVYGPENADQANVISDNQEYGVELFDATASVVAGNLIGTNAAGTAAIPNPIGVVVGDSSNNLVGTSGQDGGTDDALERNVISGNSLVGVRVYTYASGSLPSPVTTGNVFAGNYIGTSAAGTAALGNAAEGLQIYAGAYDNWVGVNAIYGPENADQRNVISGNANSAGVELTNTGTTGNTVAGNYIGTDSTGMYALPNYGGVAIDVGASGNLIGTNGDGVSDALERNVISGNSGVGVWITGAGTDSNVVAGDYVGTDVTGMVALPNGTAPVAGTRTQLTGDGVAIESGASDNLIGANGSSVDNAGERNVISGNDNDGIEIGNSGTTGNVVAGNYLGLAASGTAALGNYQAGLLLFTGATANTIGGLTAALRNVMGGNGNRGVYIFTSAGSTTPTTANVVEGNYIGTDASGMVPMSNNLNDAVSIDLSPGNTIGGTVAGAGNVLDAGDETGVAIYGDYARGPYASAAGNLIAGNIIGLAADGETAAGFGNGYDGVWIDSAPNTTIGGTVAAARNVIANNTDNDGAGILIVNFEETDGAYGTVVQGNYIGTDITGTLARGNFIGVDIEGASSSLIGTDGQDGAADALEGNLISGNLSEGIRINAASAFVGGYQSIAGAANNVVAGNLIGTNAAGTAALGNGDNGVQLEGGTTTNSIGVNTVYGPGNADERNVISGNTSAGVEITGAGTTGNAVAGDYIGTDVTGSAPLGNGAEGVEIDTGASDNTIGGTTASARNIISANDGSGVLISAANDNLVEGNYVGTDKTGTVGLGNDQIVEDVAYGGISLLNGAAGNTIGGLTATPGSGAGNLISGNTFAGVNVYYAGSNNLVAGNLIGTDVTGTVALGNLFDTAVNEGGFGVDLYYSPGNTVGEPGGRNVISGNGPGGPGIINTANVILQYSSGTAVQSNTIGTDITGTVAISNNTANIAVVGGSSITIGGLTPTPGTGLANVISGNNGEFGLDIIGVTAPVVVEGNIIGADATGQHELPNAVSGVYLYQASGVTIGGAAAGAGNLISGDNRPGNEGNIDLDQSSNNAIEGNLIGTDITGLARLPALPGDENSTGVEIRDGSTDNTIGGTTAAARNIISGLNGPGVTIADPTTTGNVVEGDYIGTDITGMVAIANGTGVELDSGASGNTIGGLTAMPGTGAGNVISGNSGDGVDLSGNGTAANLIEGDLIGTDITGLARLPALPGDENSTGVEIRD